MDSLNLSDEDTSSRAGKISANGIRLKELMKISEMKPNQLIITSLMERYPRLFKPLQSSKRKVVLQHDLDLHKLKTSIDDSIQRFGSHPWQTAEGPVLRYSGFSLNYNPDHQDDLDPNASSLGTPKNKSGEFFYGSFNNHQNLRNSYFDSYAFTTRTPAASVGYLKEILDSCSRTMIRSRMMILDGSYFDENLISQFQAAPIGDSRYGWHQDEPVYVNLRINIPITGNDAFVFEMKDEAPYVLQPGLAYSWDTNIPHRVWCRKPTDMKRYNLVVGVSPWFDYKPETGEWLPNEYCGAIHPLDMVEKGLIFPWLKSSAVRASGF